MIGGYEAFVIFNGVRLHFNQEKYDYFKYNGQSKSSPDSFNLRKDKYSFVKLGRMMDEQELPYFLAINFYEKPKSWIKDFFEEICIERYNKWKNNQAKTKRLENFSKELSTLKNLKDLIVSKENEYPELVTKIFQGEIDKDTLLVLDHFMNLSKGWDKKLQNDFIWQDFYKRYTKYKAFFYNHTFFDTSSYKDIIRSHING